MTRTTNLFIALALVTSLAGPAVAGDPKVESVEGSMPSLHQIGEVQAVLYEGDALDYGEEDSYEGEIDPEWLAWSAAMEECLETGLTEEECIEIVSPIVFAACLATARAKKNACLDQVQQDYEDGIIGSTHQGEVACDGRYLGDIVDCLNLV